MNDFLLYTAIFLCVGILGAMLGNKSGLGSVLGYLLAGIALSPVFSVFDIERERLQEFAEFGVVMMLFLVGLELSPKKVWEMRKKLLGFGGLQLCGTTLLFFIISIILGVRWTESIAIALIATGSSTALVLQSLSEKGLLKTDGGQASFSVLLFQDITVIPVLAILPFLSIPELIPLLPASKVHENVSFIQGLPSWMKAISTIFAILTIILGGHYISRPLFKYIASTRVREIFTATALFLVVGCTLLMTFVGLSPALGAFLAGVMLANSEYRHELESDIEPFKGLLLGLFFMTVGASVNFSYFFAHYTVILLLTCLLIVTKAIVLWGTGAVLKLGIPDRWVFSLGMAQVGEFAFVLLAFTAQHSIISFHITQTLMFVVTLSMLLTPLLFILLDKVILPMLRKIGSDGKAEDVNSDGIAIIAGIGRFGQIINRILRASGFNTVVLDLDAEMINTLAKIGIKAFYGNAARPDLLQAAGINSAKLLVVAINDRQQSIAIVKYARKIRPDLHIVGRAYDRLHVYDLFSAGCNDIVRETFDSATRAGNYSIQALGVEKADADFIVSNFIKHDQDSLRELAELYDPNIPSMKNTKYLEKVRQLRDTEFEILSAIRQNNSRTEEV